MSARTLLDGSQNPSPDLARFLGNDLGLSNAAAPTMSRVWRFTGPVWLWRGSGTGPPPKAAWYFLTIAGDVATSIRNTTRGRSGGFGSIRVTAQIGETAWQTSLFPSKDNGGYLLPLKAGVRRAEGLEEGGTATVELTVV